MDLYLENGDYQRTPLRHLKSINGLEERKQRAWIRLTIPKGRFIHDPELGHQLDLLRKHHPSRWNDEALALVTEALAPIEELHVDSVSVARQGDVLAITVELTDLPTQQTESLTIEMEDI